jgi:hypothetical protein
MKLWWPWLDLGKDAVASTAIATWWLVVATFFAALATAVGVWLAFMAQTRERLIERRSELRQRYEDTLDLVLYIVVVADQLLAVVVWLQGNSAAPRSAEVATAAFTRLVAVQSHQSALEALMGRQGFAVRWVLLAARAHRAVLMAARMLGARGRHENVGEPDPELSTLEMEAASLAADARVAVRTLEDHAPKPPRDWAYDGADRRSF